jgi:formylglycine-generating enzyme required for sulfatase activity
MMGQSRAIIGLKLQNTRITDVRAGGPAERAGLQKEDVIVKLNGQMVKSDSEIRAIFGGVTPGTRVKVDVLRNGRGRTFQVETAEDENLREHRVTLDAFYMDKHEVTTGRYAKFLEETGHEHPDHWNEVDLAQHGTRPVIGVNWHDAEAYCQWAGKRLPTEAEWEKAARGTDGRKYPWGNEEPSRSLANYNWDGKRAWEGYDTLSPVGSYEVGKSPYGVYDLAGNVQEWVADWYSEDYYGSSPGRNPTGPSEGQNKVLRGGSWFDTPQHVRSALRFGDTPMSRGADVGFRCAKTP